MRVKLTSDHLLEILETLLCHTKRPLFNQFHSQLFPETLLELSVRFSLALIPKRFLFRLRKIHFSFPSFYSYSASSVKRHGRFGGKNIEDLVRCQ